MDSSSYLILCVLNSDALIKTATKNTASREDQKFIYIDAIPFSKVRLSHPRAGRPSLHFLSFYSLPETFVTTCSGTNELGTTFFLTERYPQDLRNPRTQSFTCLSEEDKRSWVKDISEAINMNLLLSQVHLLHGLDATNTPNNKKE